MKFLILNDSHFSRGEGGQSTFIQNLHEELIKHAEIKYLYLPESFFRQRYVPIRLLYFIRVWIFCISFQHKKWDYIISHTPEASYAISFFKTPFCHIFHGNNNPLTKSKFWYGRYLMKVFDHFEERIKKKALICYTVGEPRVDAKRVYVPVRKQILSGNIAERSGLFYAGRLESGKDIKRTIEIFCGMSQNFKEGNKLHIIGSGTQEEYLKRFVAMKGLSDFVVFYGHMPNKVTLELINSLSLLVMTSLFEGFPMIIAESLSLGIPVVTTDVGSISDVVKNGYNGYCLPLSADNELFRKSIHKILQDYDKFSSNALDSSNVFSPQNLCNEILSFFLSSSFVINNG